jgi:hypothetical protein
VVLLGLVDQKELQNILGDLDDRFVVGDRSNVREYLWIGHLPALGDVGPAVRSIGREQGGRLVYV